MTATDLTASTEAFSAALRRQTSGDHRSAESSPFVGALATGTLPLAGYVDMLAQHAYAYAALEGAPASTLADPVVSPFLHPGLLRLPALHADLEDLAGPDWSAALPASAATERYVARIAEVAVSWPGGYVAHHYTRYLGDLSGGQHLGRVAATAYDLTPDHGGRFARFEALGDLTQFKGSYRAALDASPWDAAEQQRVVDEIRATYQHNNEVFADLAHHAPDPSPTRRANPHRLPRPSRWEAPVVTRFVLRRLAILALTLVLALTAMFAVLHASPGSAVNDLPPSVAADPQARAAVLHERGLDRPLVVQYLSYLGDVATGDLGTSLYDGSSVAAAVRTAAPVSIELGLLAAIVAIVPGVLVGVAAARSAGSAQDGAARLVTVLAISVPSYWLAVLCLVGVGERYPDLLPGAGGYQPFGEDPVANLRSLLLPAVVLGLGGFAMVGRSLRASMLGVLDGDDVRFARSMGMPERQVLRRIALRNVAPSTVTVIGLLVGGLVSGTVLVESVFQIPGLGQLMITAFTRDDHPLALGTALATATVFLGLNLLVDVVLHALDPRARRRAFAGGART